MAPVGAVQALAISLGSIGGILLSWGVFVLVLEYRSRRKLRRLAETNVVPNETPGVEDGLLRGFDQAPGAITTIERRASTLSDIPPELLAESQPTELVQRMREVQTLMLEIHRLQTDPQSLSKQVANRERIQEMQRRIDTLSDPSSPPDPSIMSPPPNTSLASSRAPPLPPATTRPTPPKLPPSLSRPNPTPIPPTWAHSTPRSPLVRAQSARSRPPSYTSRLDP
ncbi:unnamed protein product [Cyclocybe aegerita]|uniref:Uncharacterized protein n=1 Tax=Cyclocybe aegerita TaxID=1973307 RepID=A0A8S0WD05_CYCAE|nr:unnamed protein product [Cyclocybe aegerita]